MLVGGRTAPLSHGSGAFVSPPRCACYEHTIRWTPAPRNTTRRSLRREAVPPCVALRPLSLLPGGALLPRRSVRQPGYLLSSRPLNFAPCLTTGQQSTGR